MTGKRSLPDGIDERSSDWHFEKLLEFTEEKRKVGEPSPHLAMVGYMANELGANAFETAWMLGCYAFTYCLPSAQILWDFWTPSEIRECPEELYDWLVDNMKGVVTRTERRCVRSAFNMYECITDYVTWLYEEFPKLPHLEAASPHDYYDLVWKSVTGIKFIGRYIAIRLIEGLRRYCNIPAMLYDIRSVGGWSPKKCLCYLYPEHASVLLVDTAEGNELTLELSEELLEDMQEYLPWLDHYVVAAMLCEYKGAFENRHQYVGWTIDQEPLLYDKVQAYWGNDLDVDLFHKTRAALFPVRVLSEYGNYEPWNGTRWDCARVLRDYGYNWVDAWYDYEATHRSGDFSKPVEVCDGC